jgi:phosphohistidine phosphatase
MKRLLVMRHAKSSWDDESIADHERPLNPRGERNAPQMGKYVVEQQYVPDLILVSTAVRAVATAELFVAGAGCKIPVGLDRNLYHADVENYCDTVREGADSEKTLLVISHNPGVERWIYAITGEFETMPTAAIAVIHFSEKLDWVDINSLTKGSLEAVWRPKEIFGE